MKALSVIVGVLVLLLVYAAARGLYGLQPLAGVLLAIAILAVVLIVRGLTDE